MKFSFYFGLGILLAIAGLGLFAPLIAPFDPTQIDLTSELCHPNGVHLLGCDANGVDIFSTILFGAKTSLAIGIIVTVISVTVGLVVGSIAGYSGGWTDIVLMRFLEIVFAFPGIILAIAMAAAMGPSQTNLILCLSATGWAGYARLVRGEVRVLRQLEFIEAARCLGLPTWRIVWKHLWPNLLSPVLVAATFGMAGTILAEASLSYLGVGLPPSQPSWGGLLSFGRDVLLEAPHVSLFPGLAIATTVLSLHLVGEGLRRALDPKEKN